MSGSFWAIRAAFILPLVVASWAAAQSYTITDIGAAGATTYGNGINNLGQVIGQSLQGLGSSEFLYTNGAMQNLPGFHNAININDAGQIVGSTVVSGADHAALYSNGTLQDLGTLGGSFSVANGINGLGQIVGVADNTAGIQHAFVYSNGSMQDLGTLGGSTSAAYGINNSGQITGSAALATAGGDAFLYSNGKMLDLGNLGMVGSEGTAINATGQVTGWSRVNANGDTHAFLYANGTMHDLGTLGGTYSEAYDINEAGQVVGFSSLSGTEGPTDRAFLYSNGTMQNLNSLIDPNSGWVLHAAMGINDAGQIVGNGLLQGEGERAFLLTPTTPEPGACALALVAALGLLRRRRNSKDLPRV